MATGVHVRRYWWHSFWESELLPLRGTPEDPFAGLALTKARMLTKHGPLQAAGWAGLSTLDSSRSAGPQHTQLLRDTWLCWQQVAGRA